MTIDLTRSDIEALVLNTLTRFNQAREEQFRLVVSVDSPLFGRESPLDSLGLVALLIDIEEGLQDQGIDIRLTDEQAMSRRNSPFRTVATLIEYIHEKNQSES